MKTLKEGESTYILLQKLTDSASTRTRLGRKITGFPAWVNEESFSIFRLLL